MKGVKVCLTYIKVYKKAKELNVAPHFVDELKKNGMPEHGEIDLMDSGRATWSEEHLDHTAIYAAEIISDKDSTF